MKILELHAIIKKKKEIHRIQSENHENHENHRIPCENPENH